MSAGHTHGRNLSQRAMWIAFALIGSFVLTLPALPRLCRVAFRKSRKPITPRGSGCEHHGVFCMKPIKPLGHHVHSSAAVQRILPRSRR